VPELRLVRKAREMSTDAARGWAVAGVAFTVAAIAFMIATIQSCSQKESKGLPPLEELMPTFDVEKIVTANSTNYVVKFKEHDTERWVYCKDAICDTEKEATAIIEKSKRDLAIKYEFGKKIVEAMK